MEDSSVQDNIEESDLIFSSLPEEYGLRDTQPVDEDRSSACFAVFYMLDA